LVKELLCEGTARFRCMITRLVMTIKHRKKKVKQPTAKVDASTQTDDLEPGCCSLNSINYAANSEEDVIDWCVITMND